MRTDVRMACKGARGGSWPPKGRTLRGRLVGTGPPPRGAPHERGPMARTRRQLPDAEREERRRKDRERLQQATAELLTSDGWRRWLRTRSVLHGYSLTNTLLIAQQAHARGIEPTYVAGFKAWLRLGRCPRRGQKGLRI